MSEHGRVIVARMIEMIEQCQVGIMPLPVLLDELTSLCQSLEPQEQPPEREWLDAIKALERSPEGEARRRDENLQHLKSMLSRRRRAAGSIGADNQG